MAKIEIFSGPQCVHCEEAKKVLKEHALSYVEYDISKEENMALISQRLPRTRSIPQIFVDDEHIGNEVDLKLLIKNGRFAS